MGAFLENKVCTFKIPRHLSEAEADEMFWGACFVAQRFGDIQELGALSKNATNKHVKQNSQIISIEES